ncbi:hypothetical protein ASF92_10160 [Pedobacter sp. Leaf176]|nr:hypothetical protein ASF92_10160 [Pedobacter sp. Leaf176]
MKNLPLTFKLKSLRITAKSARHHKPTHVTGTNFAINTKRSFSEKNANCYLFKGFEIVALGKFCSK